jgi:hypothetical protein
MTTWRDSGIVQLRAGMSNGESGFALKHVQGFPGKGLADGYASTGTVAVMTVRPTTD